MNTTLTNDQLIRITQRANARIDELFDGSQVRTVPTITVGMVRIVLAVAAELEADGATPVQEHDWHRLGATAPSHQPQATQYSQEVALPRTSAAAPEPRSPGFRSRLSNDELRALTLTEIRRIAGSDGHGS